MLTLVDCMHPPLLLMLFCQQMIWQWWKWLFVILLCWLLIASALWWLAQNGLIHNELHCDQCDIAMSLQSHQGAKFVDRYCWACWLCMQNNWSLSIHFLLAVISRWHSWLTASTGGHMRWSRVMLAWKQGWGVCQWLTGAISFVIFVAGTCLTILYRWVGQVGLLR